MLKDEFHHTGVVNCCSNVERRTTKLILVIYVGSWVKLMKIGGILIESSWAGLGWAGLGWAGLGWAGLGWAGLGWAGLGWAGLGWAGLGWAELS